MLLRAVDQPLGLAPRRHLDRVISRTNRELETAAFLAVTLLLLAGVLGAFLAFLPTGTFALVTGAGERQLPGDVNCDLNASHDLPHDRHWRHRPGEDGDLQLASEVLLLARQRHLGPGFQLAATDENADRLHGAVATMTGRIRPLASRMLRFSRSRCRLASL